MNGPKSLLDTIFNFLEKRRVIAAILPTAIILIGFNIYAYFFPTDFKEALKFPEIVALYNAGILYDCSSRGGGDYVRCQLKPEAEIEGETVHRYLLQQGWKKDYEESQRYAYEKYDKDSYSFIIQGDSNDLEVHFNQDPTARKAQ